jgi:hypothetical protein
MGDVKLAKRGKANLKRTGSEAIPAGLLVLGDEVVRGKAREDSVNDTLAQAHLATDLRDAEVWAGRAEREQHPDHAPDGL